MQDNTHNTNAGIVAKEGMKEAKRANEGVAELQDNIRTLFSYLDKNIKGISRLGKELSNLEERLNQQNYELNKTKGAFDVLFEKAELKMNNQGDQIEIHCE